MSHISKIELEVNDLATLRKACSRIGLEFRENQKSYKWYGRYVGDYPLPEGLSADDLGRCEHAIHVPGADYEVGVVRHGKGYLLLWDFWRSGGLEERIGKGAGLLKQAYAVERTKAEARRKGYTVIEKKTEQRVRLHLRVA